MFKTFVTAISLQSKGELLKMTYSPIGFKMKKNLETAFPIVPIIANNVCEGEDVRIIVIRTDNKDTPDNFEVLVNELEALNICRDQITEITIAESQKANESRALLLKILEAIPDDSLVYGDITFGTKPMSATLLYAMSFIEKVKDAEVQGIYYGEIPREKGLAILEKAALYDLTSMKYMGDIIEQLNGLEVKDPLTALKTLLSC